ncbi:DUF788-domain-containing protein [Ramaria rubella]|nr:DUF788-domain-containing protein [Ramaria rubella]
MANASAKRIAAQNEKAIRNLRVGMVACTVLSVLIRSFLRKHVFASTSSMLIYLLTLAPSIFLYSFLVRAGAPRRATSGTLLSPGDDLNQPGLMEWSWDVIYITWACQVGSSLLGEWVWWLYLIIPSYGGYKIWSLFISPMLLGRSRLGTTESEDPNEPASKRQEKLRKRQEKGNSRTRVIGTKK